MLIVTRAGSPLKSVQDVDPGGAGQSRQLNVATINPGSTQNLAAELFTSAAGVKMAIVPFRASPDMAGAVMRGDVDVAFEFYAAIRGLLADKKIVALASTGAKRTAYLPDVPTVIESGIKDCEVASWDGLFGTQRYARDRSSGRSTEAVKDVMPKPRGSKQSEPDGYGHALERPGRHDRAHEGRYRQVGCRHRGGPAASQARLSTRPCTLSAKRLCMVLTAIRMPP